MNSLPPIAEMERAYLESDPEYNGLFFLAVKTTGIFCRPTCPARKPLPKNVVFFAVAEDARRAGFRACKRCHPDSVDEQPEWAVDLLARIDRDPTARITESEIRRWGIDPGTVRRHFLKRYGMTFQAFARSRRLVEARNRIREGDSIDAVAFDGGYESTSGFREAFTRTFCTTPSKGIDRDCVTLSWIESPLGTLLAGATEAGVCLLEFADPGTLESQFEAVRSRFRMTIVPGEHQHLDLLKEELSGYFAGTRREFTVPLVTAGTEFQTRVWSELVKIPYGTTCSYEDIAIAVGNPKAVRAVGRANGLNRIVIVIPCHRVVNKGGNLGGYGGGLRRKEFLLNLERHSFQV